MSASNRNPSAHPGASSSSPSVPVVTLYASAWRTREDVYSALLPALGAPDWHGRNLDALNDSLTSDMINSIKPPLIIRFVGLSQSSDEVREMISIVEEIAAGAREEGFAYEIEKVEADSSNSEA